MMEIFNKIFPMLKEGHNEVVVTVNNEQVVMTKYLWAELEIL